MLSQLSFDTSNEFTQDLVDAMNYFTQTGSNLLKLPSYMLSNNDIICTNDLDANTNPYEELIYTTTNEQRQLKYRYICFDDLDKFDFEYVSKQIKTIFGIDLKEYNVEVNLQTLKECATELEDDQVIPIYINTKNDIVMVIGVAKQNSKTSLSIIGTYNIQKEPYE